jgi:transcriptional regulator with XRE-family HTH domain
MTPELVFESWRSRLNATQQELADKSGMVQTQVSRLERGFDARVSTWRRLYDAMGFDLFLLPLPRTSLKAIEARAEEGRPPGSHARMRARPRKRLAGNYKRRQAEKEAAKSARARILARYSAPSDRMSA